jgi:hypothetical protein
MFYLSADLESIFDMWTTASCQRGEREKGGWPVNTGVMQPQHSPPTLRCLLERVQGMPIARHAPGTRGQNRWHPEAGAIARSDGSLGGHRATPSTENQKSGLPIWGGRSCWRMDPSEISGDACLHSLR